MEMLMVYKNNIEIYNILYNSFLSKNPEISDIKIKGMIDALFDDPDSEDKQLLDIAEKHKENLKDKVDIRPDGLCGWKMLYDVYGRNEWIDKYCIIRGSVYGEFYWPCNMIEKKQTINQQKYLRFGDRIDLILYEIKSYIEGKEPIKLNLDNKDSQRFLKNFENFHMFCERFDLFGVFVSEDKEVLDISAGNGTIINDVIVKNFSWSSNLPVDKKRKLLKNYLDNIIEICKNNPKPKS